MLVETQVKTTDMSATTRKIPPANFIVMPIPWRGEEAAAELMRRLVAPAAGALSTEERATSVPELAPLARDGVFVPLPRPFAAPRAVATGREEDLELDEGLRVLGCFFFATGYPPIFSSQAQTRFLPASLAQYIAASAFSMREDLSVASPG